MPRIVVGVDGSTDADAALRWALGEAWLRGARLDAVLAWSPDDCPRGVLERACAPGSYSVEGTALQVLQESVARARDPRRPVPVTERAVYTDAVEALISAAADADLLAVGRRGSSRLHRYLVGSVTTACLHEARCPVVVVRADGHQPGGDVPTEGSHHAGAPTGGGESPVVVGVDGSTGSLAALRWAAREAALHGAPLHVVHAWLPVSGLGLTRHADTEHDAIERLVRLALHHYVTEGLSDAPEPMVDTRLALGGSASTLLAAAMDARLLVLGSRGSGGFAGLVLGSTAHQCVHHAHCPVAVIPDESA